LCCCCVNKFDRKTGRCISVLKKSAPDKLFDHRKWLEMTAFLALLGTGIFRGAPLAPVRTWNEISWAKDSQSFNS
jgi:hypothetical protein